MSSAMPGSVFSHPLKRERKNIYCFQVWQCSIIKTILMESSFPRITEDPWTDFPAHAAHTSGLYHTVWWLSLSFEPHQLHKGHRKVPALCLPGVILWTCLPRNKKLPNWRRGLTKLTPDASSAQVSQDRLTGSPSRELLHWRLHRHVMSKHIGWYRRVCQTAEL